MSEDDEEYGRIVTTTTWNPHTEIAGDADPDDFDWKTTLSAEETMRLFERNAIIQIATSWSFAEAIRAGWVFKKNEGAIVGQKHGEEYTFENFEEYLEWISFQTELQNAGKWALVFGTSYMIFFNEDLDISQKNAAGVYDRCQAFHPLVDGNGITVQDVDKFGRPLKYELHLMTEGMKQSLTIVIDASRVIEFVAPKDKIKYGGSPRCVGLDKMALAEEQMLKALVKRAKDVAGGFLNVPVETEAQALAANTNIGQSITYLKRLFTKNGYKPEYITPDLKAAGEFTAIFNIISLHFSRHLRVSQQALEGLASGTLSSAEYNFLYSYTYILQLQAHFKATLERCFYKLGKKDTRFIWNDPFPDQGMGKADLTINHQFQGSNPEEKQGVKPNDGTTTSDASSNGDASQASGSDTTQ
jgi:hypothetical protein